MNEDSSSTPAASEAASVKKATDFLVQYIVLRKDLNWPLGALITQCCHASISAIHLNSSDQATQDYLHDLDNMHKVTLGAENEQDLENLRKKLEENNVKFKLWIEQPENIPTCLATKPYMKKDIEKLFKKFKLLK